MRWRRLLHVIGTLLLLAAVLPAALWFWSGTSSSLATSLRVATALLPAGQTLAWQDVQGSLREGGRLGHLRWQQGGLHIEAQQVEVAWSWRALRSGPWQVTQLRVARLLIDDQRPPSPPSAPASLVLPLQLELPFQVGTLDWRGPPALQASGLAGHYRFDGTQHSVRLDGVQIAAGRYRGQASVLARAPMTLDARLAGDLSAPVPGGHPPLPVQARATLMGNLSGHQPLLELQLALQPQEPAQALRAEASARLRPWQAQPIEQASADWRALDLALFWPGAPRTALSGSARVTPQGAGWHASVEARNTLPGPWDQQRLPLRRLNASLDHLDPQWTVRALQAEGAGGQLEAEGRVLPAAGPGQHPTWQGSARLRGIDPAALHRALPAAALDGELTARQATPGASPGTTGPIAFEAQLRAAGRTPPAGLPLQRASVRGRWQGDTLTLDTLQLQGADAQLQAQLTHQLASRATSGQLALTLPGARLDAQGHLAARDGQGRFELRVTQADAAWRWLARWPGLSAALGPAAPRGSASWTGQWRGGWQPQGQALTVQSTLDAPRLDWQPANAPATPAWQLRDLHAELAGRLGDLSFTLQGRAQQGTRQYALQTQARGGRGPEGAWQGQLDRAQLTLQDGQRPDPWTAQLAAGLPWRWETRPARQALSVAAGQLQLTGPAPGQATVSWQPLRWQQQGQGSAARQSWQTRGQLQGLPLGWLEQLGGATLAELGLRGDLVFGGDWDLTLADTLRARATLARTGGDLALQHESAPAGGLSAGVREARLTLSAEGEQLSARLRWDSERAGQLEADLATRLRRDAGGWQWPADAPLAGTLRAQLPRVGAWSVLAPPGWRIQGTLAAQASLTGTRAAPQWRGTLQADELSVRSVVDGIEFSQGRLRAGLQGQRLQIDELSLRGAGEQGGALTAQGFVEWLPAGASRLRMALDAQAQALRVSARADRRLVVSGQVQARLEQARLSLRGALKADQALFILPDDTAPSLGRDVVVRSARTAAPTGAPRVAPGGGVRVVPDVALTLDLGPDFRLRGRGLSTRLAGTLELRSTSPAALAPRLNGELRTVRGSYQAYGQQLDIEEGVLRFNGPYDNPALDVLAIRPNLSVRVGVRITGTAQAPRVRLYADPELPEAEKLAWLVLGRGAASGGGEAAVLQQAALALLGGQGKGLSGGLAQALGLDELTVGRAATSADGTTTGAAVTLGKRLSRNFYLAYERSLAGTLGTFYIFYDLSRRFTVRAQTGEQSAVDLIFTLRYD